MFKLVYFSLSQKHIISVYFPGLDGVSDYFRLCSDDIDFVDHFVKVVKNG